MPIPVNIAPFQVSYSGVLLDFADSLSHSQFGDRDLSSNVPIYGTWDWCTLPVITFVDLLHGIYTLRLRWPNSEVDLKLRAGLHEEIDQREYTNRVIPV